MQRIVLYALVGFLALANLIAEPAQRPPVLARIALLSDTHTTLGTNYSLHTRRLARVIDHVNAAKVDLVLIAGDLTQDGKPGELQAFKSQIRRLQALTCYVPGNHDVGNKIVKTETKTDSVNSWRVRYFERFLGRSFYARSLAGVRVVAVNSALLGSGLPQEKRQWKFLEQQITESQPQPLVVLSHYPPFVERPDEPAEYWNIEPGPRQRLLAWLNQVNARIFLSGHLHRQIVNRHEGRLLVTSIPVAFGLQPRPVIGWTLVTLPAETEPSVEFIQVHDAESPSREP